MIKIGVTGNIASGKSTFTTFFDKKNTFIFNADKEAKKHLKKHSVLQKKLVNSFGKKILIGRDLDFKKLAEISFENKINQKILNGIMWPEVLILIEQAYKEAKKQKNDYFVVDAALLFEANYQNFFDYIILIMANKENRLKRAIKRKNMDIAQINKRMKLQMPDKEKMKLSHFIIKNDSDINYLEKKFQAIFKKLI